MVTNIFIKLSYQSLTERILVTLVSIKKVLIIIDKDIELVMRAYSKEDLARKYLLAQEEVLSLEREKKKLIKIIYSLRRDN